MSGLEFLEEDLQQLQRQGRRRFRRDLTQEQSRALLWLCSNDYLGYATRRVLNDSLRQAADRAQSGAAASRLIAGDHAEHRELERVITQWVDQPDALVFSSGYAANVGLMSSLVGPEDVVLSDALNHASIIDGVRLSKARVVVTPHNNLEQLETALESEKVMRSRRRFVVTEGYFSMDGDTPDLLAIRKLCDHHHAVMIVDEAHSLGLFGPQGAGSCAAVGCKPDIMVGTFGKSLGGQGAFVAGPKTLTDWLWNKARSFVFSTGISPAIAAINTVAIERVQNDDESRQRVFELATRLRTALTNMGYQVGPGSGPIIPVMIGADSEAVRISNQLKELGIMVAPIRPPTVPEGTARLRVTVNASLSDDDILRAEKAFAQVAQQTFTEQLSSNNGRT